MFKAFRGIGVILLLLLVAACSEITGSVAKENNVEQGDVQEDNAIEETESNSNESPDQVYSVETEEITTGLKDGRFVRIYFEFVTSNEEGKYELEKRDFQVKNILLKELEQMTAEQVEDFGSHSNSIKEQINMLLNEGQIAEVSVTEFMIQGEESTTHNVNENNPYGKSDLHPATIEQLDDPLYYNQILPDELKAHVASGEKVTVYFYSPTCKYCLNTTPIIVPLAEENGIDLKLFNVLEFEEFVTYGIEATPTLIHFEGGQEAGRIVGQHPPEEFQAFIDGYVLN